MKLQMMTDQKPEEDPEERNVPKYFKVKKNGVKFFAIVSILSSIVMFASGICYLSKSDEEKEIKANGKVIIFSYLGADILIQLLGLFGAFKEQIECIKVYGGLITLYIIFSIIRFTCGADLVWMAIIWNTGGLLVTIAFYRDLMTIEEQYDYTQV